MFSVVHVATSSKVILGSQLGKMMGEDMTDKKDCGVNGNAPNPAARFPVPQTDNRHVILHGLKIS